MSVNTYNITSYGTLTESKVMYEVKESFAEFSSGFMRLFASLVWEEDGEPGVAAGAFGHRWVPDKHLFQHENLNSMLK